MKLFTKIKDFFKLLFASKKTRSYMYNDETEKKIKELNKEIDDLLKKHGGKL